MVTANEAGDGIEALRETGIAALMFARRVMMGLLEEISDETVRRAISDQVVHWLPAACYLAEEWRAE